MEHTPGPWKVEDEFVSDDEGNDVCEISLRSYGLDESEMDANARLIAAAPDLLEVLEELLENGTCYLSAIELDHNYDGEEWEKKARTAIAKAKGQ